MRIERLEIKNFRCLEDITIIFPDKNIAVIVGINGAGKTTILDGLKIVLSSIINQLIQLEIKKDFVLQDIIGSLTIIEQDEIHYTAESSQIDAVIKENDEQIIKVLCTAKILEDKYSESTDSKITGVDYIEQYSHDSHQNFPLFVYYHDRPVKQIKPSKISFHRQQLNIYRGCMQVVVDDFEDFTQWFEREESYENERRLREEPRVHPG